jgi:hypothetical protein
VLDLASVRSANPARKGYLGDKMQKYLIEFPFIFINKIDTQPLLVERNPAISVHPAAWTCMSGIGSTKRTCRLHCAMSALRGIVLQSSAGFDFGS